MKNLLIDNVSLPLPAQWCSRGWLATNGSAILECGSGAAPAGLAAEAERHIDGAGLTLLPGFIDLHAHGALGYEAMDGLPEQIDAISSHFAAHGVTAFLGTTWTASHSRTLESLRGIRKAMEMGLSGAALLGAHLEGPYLNPDYRGAQEEISIRRGDTAEMRAYLDTGAVRLLTLAPEYNENLALVDMCRQQQVVLSAGHSGATCADMQRAIKCGITQVTHTFNAMRPLHHREPGLLGAALTHPEVMCELIADNIHVHPAVISLLHRAKGVQGVRLITDSVFVAGLPEGTHQYAGMEIRLQNNAARLPNGALAGSVLSMENALRNYLNATGCSLQDAWPVSSLNSARALGMEARKGSLQAGADADLVLLADDLQVVMTIVGGGVVYQSPQLR